MLIAMAVAPAVAEALEFSSRVAEVRAEPGTEKVTAKFTFKNTGSTREKIYQIETNCGCLSAKADRSSLAPGESGTLTAVFNVKGKTGAFGKALSVVAGAAKRETIRLEVHVFIPEVVILEPSVVSWKVGEKPSSKTVRAKMNYKSPIHILQVESSRPAVEAKLSTVKDGSAYEIRITPQTTDGPLLGVIRLDTDCPIPEQRRQMVFFRIEK